MNRDALTTARIFLTVSNEQLEWLRNKIAITPRANGIQDVIREMIDRQMYQEAENRKLAELHDKA